MALLQKILVAGLALWLTACASINETPGFRANTRDPLDAFLLEARFTLRHESGHYSGRLSWRHSPSHDELLLSSPLGQGIAEIRRTREGVQLRTQDGQQRSAGDLPTLTQQLLGFPLPLDMLTGWLFGRSHDGRITASDDTGRPRRLIDRGWYIGLEYDNPEPSAAPSLLIVERDSVLELRLRVDELSPLPAPPGETR